jgi:hypothetical protein
MIKVTRQLIRAMPNCNFVTYATLIGELCAEVTGLLNGCNFRCEILTVVHYWHNHQFK